MKHNINYITTENTSLLITAESKTIYYKYILEGNRKSTLSTFFNNEETYLCTHSLQYTISVHQMCYEILTKCENYTKILMFSNLNFRAVFKLWPFVKLICLLSSWTNKIWTIIKYLFSQISRLFLLSKSISFHQFYIEYSESWWFDSVRNIFD